MNKNNKLLLGVLAFIVACTIGYALFSENISITGTATAKGDFSITTSCTPGLYSELNVTSKDVTNYLFDTGLFDSTGGFSTVENGYNNDTCSVNGNKVSFAVNFEYPSAMRYFTFKFTNTGSIPAKIKDIPYTTGEHYVNDVLQEGPNGNYLLTGELVAAYYNGNFISDEIYDIVLNPNDSVYFIYYVFWHVNDTSNDNFERKFITEDEVLFEQITE